MLTESQKNYIALFMLAGEVSENELRMFLAKSAWDIGSIDAAVKYTGDTSLKKSVTEASLSESAVMGTHISKTDLSLNTQNTVVNDSLSSFTPSNSQADIYKEIPVVSMPENSDSMVIENSMEVTKKEQEVIKSSLSNIDDLSLYHNSASSSSVPAPKNTMSDIVPISVMSQEKDIKITSASRTLSIVIWALVFVLIAAIASILGYMYYSGTGFFSNLTYIKLQ